jgi:DNA polymerase/3'-5' exonuclease PolX
MAGQWLNAPTAVSIPLGTPPFVLNAVNLLREKHMELKKAKAIADELAKLLLPGCKRIIVAGSIRRQKPDVGDIELLCIPQFDQGIDLLDRTLGSLMLQQVFDYRRNRRGRIAYGPKNKLLLHKLSGIGVDIFSTDEECWWVSLVVRTGGKATNVEIATRAKERGMRFHAYGRGFTQADGSELVCRSEQDVFRAVGLRYLEPWERR